MNILSRKLSYNGPGDGHSRRDIGNMAVEVKKDAGGNFVIKVDEQSLVVDPKNARLVLAHLAQLIRPETAAQRSDRTAEFLAQLRTASDSGIQNLLRGADHDDVLVLLKLAEDDTPLRDKLYGNMTSKSAQIYAEDVEFKFQSELPGILVEDAMGRLRQTARELVENGTLKYEKPAP